MKEFIRSILPDAAVARLSELRHGLRRAHIAQPSGQLRVEQGTRTFLMAVGPAFDQRRPDAMMACRMGYCHAFEQMGVPYCLVDVRDVARKARDVPSPFVMYFAGDLAYLPRGDIASLRDIPSAVWVYPRFEHSRQFFEDRGLDSTIWTLPESIVGKVLDLQPRFGFTATVPSGLDFFSGWERSGLPVHSFPLACDTAIYTPDSPRVPEFEGVELAFVGGYWRSKGVQIDDYLRPFEDRLRVYGYSKWPYKGYGGQLPVEREPSLYRQARLCPVINEPTVALMKGQINERVFKVFGAGGCAIADAVPAYRELYTEDELLIAKNASDFAYLVNELLRDAELNHSYRQKGRRATMERHTYRHRAEDWLRSLGLPKKIGATV